MITTKIHNSLAYRLHFRRWTKPLLPLNPDLPYWLYLDIPEATVMCSTEKSHCLQWPALEHLSEEKILNSTSCGMY